MPLYSFDTSAFVNPARRYYPFDVFPTFWKAIEARIANGEIIATDIVKDEIEQKDDELTEWAKTQNGLFVSVTKPCQQHASGIIKAFPKWVDATSGKNDADPWVVALAMEHTITVVSDERGGGPSKVKIPYVCGEMKVNHMRVIDFIRHIGLKM